MTTGQSVNVKPEVVGARGFQTEDVVIGIGLSGQHFPAAGQGIFPDIGFCNSLFHRQEATRTPTVFNLWKKNRPPELPEACAESKGLELEIKIGLKGVNILIFIVFCNQVGQSALQIFGDLVFGPE